jgi:hypothetical protein
LFENRRKKICRIDKRVPSGRCSLPYRVMQFRFAFERRQGSLATSEANCTMPPLFNAGLRRYATAYSFNGRRRDQYDSVTLRASHLRMQMVTQSLAFLEMPRAISAAEDYVAQSRCLLKTA